jgi:glutaredoxin
MSKNKNGSEVVIYVSRGMYATHEIENKIVPKHKDWKIIDYSDVCTDEELYHKFEKAGVRSFPIIVINGKIVCSGTETMTAEMIESIVTENAENLKC